MSRRLSFAFLIVTLLLPILSHGSPSANAQSGTCTNNLYLVAGQDFWVGDLTPTNESGEVIVFVHGFTSDHTAWIGSNHATQVACENGFRVAAVDLMPDGSIWNNSRELTAALLAIREHYGVSRVNIMAHSKGGVDTQTAIVHRNAFPLIESYIAFATPFGGSELADLACTFGLPLGLCNPATFTLRTGYMSFVRSITDGQPQNDQVEAYMARGSECLPFFLAFTCLLIPGEDDGVVAVWSAYGTTEAQGISDRDDLHHIEMHYLQNYPASIFSYFDDGPDIEQTPAVTPLPPRFATSNYAARGGLLTGRVVETIAVEEGVEAVTFRLLANHGAQVAVISPGGTHHQVEARRSPPDAILRGTSHTIRIEEPETGIWQVVATPAAGTANTAYMLQAIYQGSIALQWDVDLSRVYRPSSALPLSLNVSQA
ncbi:MAG: esterase/lipase family protein, partial [Ardenticatenaceae bacterium]